MCVLLMKGCNVTDLAQRSHALLNIISARAAEMHCQFSNIVRVFVWRLHHGHPNYIHTETLVPSTRRIQPDFRITRSHFRNI